MMKKWVLAAAAATSVMAAGGLANAAAYITTNPPAPDGSINGVFGNNGVTGAGTFSDTFSFSLPSAGDLVGSFTTSATKTGGTIDPNTNIDFLSATLNGSPITIGPNGQFETNFFDKGTVGGTQMLVINYKSDGVGATYSGTLAFTPTGVVPEAASWALMIVGFGATGAMMRLRRDASSFA